MAGLEYIGITSQMRSSLIPSLLALSALAAVVPPPVTAGITSTRSLSALLAESGYIVIADVVSGQSTQSGSKAMVRVIRSIKGSASEGQLLHIWSDARSQSAKVPYPIPSGRGLFFLKGESQADLEIVPVMTGSVVTFNDSYFDVPASSGIQPLPGPAVSSVLAEILITLFRTAEQGRTPGRGALFDLAHMVRSHWTELPESAYHALLVSPSPKVVEAAAAGLIGYGRGDAVLAHIEARRHQIGPHERKALLAEVAARTRQAEAGEIQRLGLAATLAGEPMDARVAAAAALARVHTAPTLPFLAALLADPDQRLQALGVGGLAAFANNTETGSFAIRPGPWEYRTEETIRMSVMDESAFAARSEEYLSFWLGWWDSHRGRVAAASAANATPPGEVKKNPGQ